MPDDPPDWFLEGLVFVLALATTMNTTAGVGPGIGPRQLVLAVGLGAVVYVVGYRLVLVEEQHAG